MAASCGGGGAASLSLRPRAPECDPLLAVQAPLSGPEGGAVPTLLVRIPVLVETVSFSLPITGVSGLLSWSLEGPTLCSPVGPHCLNFDLV